jgi:L-iditol 2-dehydrogenase
MNAYFVKAPFIFEERETAMPELDHDDVVVKMKACGVCGFDVLVSSTLAKHYMPIGHEISGIVEQTGSRVRGFSKGMKVALENSTFCGICSDCKNGHVMHCTHLSHFGSPSGFAEYVKVKDRSLHRIDSLGFEAGALVEPLTVALDMVEHSDLQIGCSAAVFGPGPIGLMIAKLAQMKGAGRVFLLGHSRSKARWRVAEALGIKDVIYVDKVEITELFAKRLPGGVDRVLLTSPPKTIADAIEIAKFGGIITYNGIEYGKGRFVRFDANKFHFKRLQLRGCHSVPNLMFPIAIDLIKGGAIDPELFVTHRFSLSETGQAIGYAAENRDKVVKVMVMN